MNRIILIGNGFDLAHGLETSYSQFIDDFWKKRIALIKVAMFNDEIFSDEFVTVKPTTNIFPDSTETYSDLKKLYRDLIIYLTFENEFFEKVTEKRELNWVDIENLYFHELMKIINDYEFIKRSRSEYELNVERIKQLNRELSDIKYELEEYLLITTGLSKNKINRDGRIVRNIYSEIKLNDFTSEGRNAITDEWIQKIKSEIDDHNRRHINDPKTFPNFTLERVCLRHDDGTYEFNSKAWNTFIEKKDTFHEYLETKPTSYMFLNFNYTSTELAYVNSRDFIGWNTTPVDIHIHGELRKPDNPIIFGYGDEISKDYLRLEEFSGNELLENVKSIEYLNTDNYRRLLEYIDSDVYQIFIMGHSCGNSDRTLLNTLFEHKNCTSIKVYYHQKSLKEDNYSDIIRNISRNFKDKKLMRERVVNKQRSEPLIRLS
jgi:hypothetical protein